MSAAVETKRIPHPVLLRDTFIHQADLVATEPRLSVSPCSSPGLICSSRILLFISSLLALHSARIITNDNGVTRPDTSLFSTLSSCTNVRLSFLCARFFLLSVSLFVGANGDKETYCPAFVCRGERRADQHGTNCFPPSPVNYVRYAFIIKVYQLGGKMTLSDEPPHRFIRQTAGAEHAHIPEMLIKRAVPSLHPPALITVWLGGPSPWQLTVWPDILSLHFLFNINSKKLRHKAERVYMGWVEVCAYDLVGSNSILAN